MEACQESILELYAPSKATGWPPSIESTRGGLAANVGDSGGSQERLDSFRVPEFMSSLCSFFSSLRAS